MSVAAGARLRRALEYEASSCKQSLTKQLAGASLHVLRARLSLLRREGVITYVRSSLIARKRLDHSLWAEQKELLE